MKSSTRRWHSLYNRAYTKQRRTLAFSAEYAVRVHFRERGVCASVTTMQGSKPPAGDYLLSYTMTQEHRGILWHVQRTSIYHASKTWTYDTEATHSNKLRETPNPAAREGGWGKRIQRSVWLLRDDGLYDIGTSTHLRRIHYFQ